MIDNPSFEDGDPDGIWGKWAECTDGFLGDEGTMMVSFQAIPEGDWPSLAGAIPVYKDGWTHIGMAWSADGTVRYYSDSKKRPWWARGILYRLWYRYVMTRGQNTWEAKDD